MTVKSEARKLALRLVGNPELFNDFKLGMETGVEEAINKKIEDLVVLQKNLTGFLSSISNPDKIRKEAALKTTASRASKIASLPEKVIKTKRSKKTKRRQRRKPGDHELRLRKELRDSDTLTRVVKRLFGSAASVDEASESMWFKTTDLVRKVWQECFEYRLSTEATAQYIAHYIVPTLSALEKSGRAIRKGNARHTRWLILE